MKVNLDPNQVAQVLELAETVRGLAKHALNEDNSKQQLLALSLLSAYLSDNLTVMFAE
jgi:hypothetical protein